MERPTRKGGGEEQNGGKSEQANGGLTKVESILSKKAWVTQSIRSRAKKKTVLKEDKTEQSSYCAQKWPLNSRLIIQVWNALQSGDGQ